ncbi:MAG: PhzF family phenazine biosynthesis protein, partial [Halocynthiibacter sp.]
MNVYKIAAFSHGTDGGNPAGVVLGAQGVSADDMQKMAAKIGYSETAFLTEISEKSYRVRYFSPESEVPFCGHATIALGAVLAKQKGAGRYDLTLNEAEIQVEAVNEDGQFQVALQSPPTQSTPLDDSEIAATLALFGMGQDVLHPDIPPARIHGGAD